MSCVSGACIGSQNDFCTGLQTRFKTNNVLNIGKQQQIPANMST